MKKKYFEYGDEVVLYGDEVVLTKGKFKGMLGVIKQVMPNGMLGIRLSNGKYFYFENSKGLKLLKVKKNKSNINKKFDAWRTP